MSHVYIITVLQKWLTNTKRYIQKSVEINQHGILKVLRQPTGRQAKENTNGNQEKRNISQKINMQM